MHAFLPSWLHYNRARHSEMALLVDNGRCAGVVPVEAVPADLPRTRLRGLLAPGYVEMQINGAGGVIFSNAPTLESIRIMNEVLLRHGVTSFLPTIISASEATVDAAICATEDAKKELPTVLGMHLEGPHFSIDYRGTHDPNLLRPMAERDVTRIKSAAARGLLPITTVAPEQVTLAQIAEISDAGVCVALGHTGCSAGQALAAAEAGARMLTHLYNGMPPMKGRDPGPVGAFFGSDKLMATIIPDGAHSDPISLRAAYRSRPEGLALVSDATATREGTPDAFEFGGHSCRIVDGVIRNETGGLAGAAILLDEMVQRMAKTIGDADTAIEMATAIPARLIGADTSVGSFDPGLMADFNLLDPDDLSVKAVWKAGHCVHCDDAQRSILIDSL